MCKFQTKNVKLVGVKDKVKNCILLCYTKTVKLVLNDYGSNELKLKNAVSLLQKASKLQICHYYNKQILMFPYSLL